MYHIFALADCLLDQLCNQDKPRPPAADIQVIVNIDTVIPLWLIYAVILGLVKIINDAKFCCYQLSPTSFSGYLRRDCTLSLIAIPSITNDATRKAK